MRLIFMGSPDFSVPALHALHQAGHDIAAVYTQPPRPAGRGKALRRQPVHEAAEALGLPVRTPLRLRHNTEEHEIFAAFQADAAIVAAYGLLLPPEILKAPPLGCLNIHASLLPRWRGASPIQSAIRAGDKETGVSIMQMDAGLDTGAVLLKDSTPIHPHDTAGTLHDRLSSMGARLILRALEEQPNAVPQDDTLSCYAPRLSRTDGRINWALSAHEIDQQVRAFTPWPGSFTRYNGQIFRIGAVTPYNDASPSLPGTLINNELHIACGKGSLRIDRLQKPGRAMMDASSFLRGSSLPEGGRFD